MSLPLDKTTLNERRKAWRALRAWAEKIDNDLFADPELRWQAGELLRAVKLREAQIERRAKAKKL